MTIQAASDKAKLTDKERALLFFYAKQKQGFTPAEKLVLKQTGISQRRLRNVRDSLRKMNVIDYGNTRYKHFVFVNWTVIRGLAFLDDTIISKRRSTKYFIPMEQKCFRGHPYFSTGRKLKYDIGYIRHKPTQAWIEYGNTAESWKRWREYLRKIGEFTKGEYWRMAEDMMLAEGIERKLPAHPKAEIGREPIVYSSPR